MLFFFFQINCCASTRHFHSNNLLFFLPPTSKGRESVSVGFQMPNKTTTAADTGHPWKRVNQLLITLSYWSCRNAWSRCVKKLAGPRQTTSAQHFFILMCVSGGSDFKSFTVELTVCISVLLQKKKAVHQGNITFVLASAWLAQKELFVQNSVGRRTKIKFPRRNWCPEKWHKSLV